MTAAALLESEQRKRQHLVDYECVEWYNLLVYCSVEALQCVLDVRSKPKASKRAKRTSPVFFTAIRARDRAITVLHKCVLVEAAERNEFEAAFLPSLLRLSRFLSQSRKAAEQLTLQRLQGEHRVSIIVDATSSLLALVSLQWAVGASTIAAQEDGDRLILLQSRVFVVESTVRRALTADEASARATLFVNLRVCVEDAFVHVYVYAYRF